MDIVSRVKTERKQKRDRGFTVVQVVIAVTLMGIVSSFAAIGIVKARASLRLSGAAREVAGYLEKARGNAIRRNDGSTVTIVNANSYSVTMDFDGDGTVETRTMTLPTGITFKSGSIGASAVFDWRGRVPNQVGIELQNEDLRVSSINLSGSGDVTLDSEIFSDASIGDVTLNSDVPSAVASPSPGSSPSASPIASPTATPTPAQATPTPTPIPATPTPTPYPTPTPTPTPAPTPTPTATPTPSPSPTPIPCSITAPSSVTFAKNGGSRTFTATLSNGSSTVVTATKSGSGITGVTPATTTVTGSGNILYTVSYSNGTNSGGSIQISSPCGNKTVTVIID